MRRGTSLISLMVAITILSGFVIVFGVLLRTLMLAEGRSAGQIVEHRRWEDLMVQFRRDVHAASHSELGVEAAAGQSLKLKSAEGDIEYVTGGDRVERKAPAGRNENWRFPGQSLTLVRDPEGRWITLQRSGPPASRRDDPHPAALTRILRLDAEIGRLGRHSATNGEAAR